MTWHSTSKAGPLIRLAGALLLALGSVVGTRLFGAPTRSPGACTYLLALIGFAAVSAGSAMLALGGHLLDDVPLSPCWTPRW